MSRSKAEAHLYDATLFESSAELNVVQASFKGSSHSSFDKLLTGYSTLRVLTYSSSVSIVEKASRLVDDVEIIFGREDIVNEMAKYLHYQQLLVEELKQSVKGNQSLRDRIDAGKLRLFVVSQMISHEKLFLLEGDAGQRVITGSANFSELAFSGNQNESFICFDDDANAWRFFTEKYNRIRSQSSLGIAPSAVVEERFEAEHIPALHPSEPGDASPQFIVIDDRPPAPTIRHKLLVSRTPKQYQGLSQILTPNRGVVHITRQLRSQVVQYIRSNSRSSEENPEEYLSIYPDSGEVVLSGKKLDLEADRESIRSDARILAEYFAGYEQFRGDTKKLAKDYFTFMSWFYISPFICDFRNRAIANVTDELNHLDYPIVGILYGKSNCGKSELIKTLQLSMFQQEGFLPIDWFTKGQVATLREQNKRFPLLFDDLDRTRFSNHAIPLIKDDNLQLNEYPAIVLSMNADKDTFETEVRKRALIIYTGASLPDHTGESRRLGASVKRMKRQLGNAFYREYLRRVLESLQDRIPRDILAFSSQILSELFEEYLDEERPHWCHVTSMDEYTLTKYDKVKSELRDLIENHPDAWSANGNKVLLRIEDVHYIRKLSHDIPDYLIRNRSGSTIVFYGDELESFLEHPVFPRKRFRSFLSLLMPSKR